MAGAFSSGVGFPDNFSTPPVRRPFKADMPAVDGKRGPARREVFYRITMEFVRLRTGLILSPFPGEQYFHLAVNSLHGHRVLIGAAQVFLHEDYGGHERQSGNREDGDGHNCFQNERAALSTRAGSGLPVTRQ
jgi:hypothetical protein